MGHFYTIEGSPKFTVLKKDGTERQTTIKDAKQMGLLPSVTTCTQTIYSYPLQQWNKKQILKAVLSNPAHLNDYTGTEESFEDVFNFYQNLQTAQNNSPIIGMEIHKAIEEFIKENKVPSMGSIEFRFLGRIKLFLNSVFGESYELQSETPFAANGYGGTVDLVVKTAEGKKYVLDFKTTTRTKFEQWKQPYIEEIAQIAAYIKGLRFGKSETEIEGEAYVVKIDNEKGGVKAFHLQSTHLHRGWNFFNGCIKAYAYSNDYDIIAEIFDKAKTPDVVKKMMENYLRKDKTLIKEDNVKFCKEYDDTEGVEAREVKAPLPKAKKINVIETQGNITLDGGGI